MKILAAMSGGVDSAVAAARAVEAGHEVVGVHLALSRMPGTLRTGSRGCCTLEDSMDARRVCAQLGIPFFVWDFSERFKEDVVDDFIAEYEAGRTPNPCMRCNEKIKFAALLERAVSLGFDAVVTGHYARVITNDDGNRELHRAADWAKDQSYVLGVLTHEQLKHAWFPLATTPSKAEVRAEAERRGFSVAKKPDSYDICFIPEGDTRAWLGEHIQMRPGMIKDTSGNVVGEHPGAQGFTVGQRKGLALGTPAPDGKPRFVLEIRPKTNEVIVGSRGYFLSTKSAEFGPPGLEFLFRKQNIFLRRNQNSACAARPLMLPPKCVHMQTRCAVQRILNGQKIPMPKPPENSV